MIANPAYYLHDYADEALPRDLNGVGLDGWTAWLAQGGDAPEEGDDPDDPSGWHTDVPQDGQEFRATETTWLDDVTATMSGDGEIIFDPPLPADYDFLAFRFAPRMGWSPENILDDPHEPAASIRDQDLLDRGDSGDLAVGKSREVVLVYRANHPRLEIAGEIQ